MTLGLAKLMATGGVPLLVTDDFNRHPQSVGTWPHSPYDPMGDGAARSRWEQYPGYGFFEVQSVYTGDAWVYGATSMPPQITRFGGVTTNFGWLTTIDSHSTDVEARLGVGVGGRNPHPIFGIYGGDCLYFRVKDPENWWRVRVFGGFAQRTIGPGWFFRDLGRYEDRSSPAAGVPAHFHPGYYTQVYGTLRPEHPPWRGILWRGQEIRSSSGRTWLAHQTDGNVVLYRDGVSRWASGTNGRTTDALVLQTDGNLVLMAPGSQPIWSLGTTGQATNPYLIVQNDGNLVLYRPNATAYWASNTNVPLDDRDRWWAAPADGVVTHEHDGWPMHTHRANPGLAHGGDQWGSLNQGFVTRLHLDCKVNGTVTTRGTVTAELWNGPDATGSLAVRVPGLLTRRLKVRAVGHRIDVMMGDELNPLITVTNATEHYGATKHGLGRGYSEHRNTAMHDFRVLNLR